MFCSVILSFADAETELLWDTGKNRRIPASRRAVAARKLAQLDSAQTLKDLSWPPGNRLEALVGNRSGLHSIHINNQFRLCFLWRDGNAFKAEIVNYH